MNSDGGEGLDNGRFERVDEVSFGRPQKLFDLRPSPLDGSAVWPFRTLLNHN
jgi:hypothetical protein